MDHPIIACLSKSQPDKDSASWVPADGSIAHNRVDFGIPVPKELKNGVVAWIDRKEYTYEDVPEEMHGSTLYSFRHKPVGGGYFTVQAPVGSTVYIFSEVDRDGGFPALGWDRVKAGRFSWQQGANPNDQKWSLVAWKKVHDGHPLVIQTPECLVGGVAIAAQKSSQAAEHEVRKEEDAKIYSQSDVDEMHRGWEKQKLEPLLQELSELRAAHEELQSRLLNKGDGSEEVMVEEPESGSGEEANAKQEEGRASKRRRKSTRNPHEGDGSEEIGRYCTSEGN